MSRPHQPPGGAPGTAAQNAGYAINDLLAARAPGGWAGVCPGCGRCSC